MYMCFCFGKIDIRFNCFGFGMQFYLQRAESDESEFLKALSKRK